MEIQFLFLFILFCILIYYLSYSYIEHYDAKISNTDKVQCGQICTSAYGCSGFGHKPNGSCYISRTSILQQPIDTLYGSEYNIADYRCNKLQPIYREADITVPEVMKRNALYNCAESENGEYVLELISQNKVEPLYDFDDVNSLDVPEYELLNFHWPDHKMHIDYKDTFGKVLPTHIVKPVNSTVLYQQKDDEYLGSYLYPKKCVDNIPEKECLDICTKDDECIGIEWNPFYVRASGENEYKIYEKVCCPKKQVKTVIPRRSDFENGKFYLKTYEDKFPSGYGTMVSIN